MTENKEEGARFSPRTTYYRTTQVCCVYGCQSRTETDSTVRFHHFPVSGNDNPDPEKHRYVHAAAEKRRRYKMWLTNLKINKKYLSTGAAVCSLHFKREDYVLPDVALKRRLLKTTAFPTLNLPTSEQRDEAEREIEAEKSRRGEMKRKNKIQKEQNEIVIKQEVQDEIVIKHEPIYKYFPNTEEFASNLDIPPAKKKYVKEKKKKDVHDPLVDPLMLTDEADGLGTEKKTKRKGKTIKKNTKKDNYVEVILKEEHEDVPIIGKDYVDIGVRAEISDTAALKWSALLTTDKELSNLTGIPNFDILRRIVEAVKMVYPEKRIITNLDTRDKVIMTLMKLRHDISYSVLSSLFKCARISLCRNMIYNTLTKLSNVLKHSIEFPTMEELLFNRPECFKDFNNVRMVIDRVEITVQRPNNLCCQLALFSHHNNYKVKFMTGYTPAGLISFVSKAYSGRASDNSIFEQSKIVEQLNRGEAIMTGRDFSVESICSGYGVELIRPITGNENDKIAKALVHIDKANQRLKMFQVLNTKVPLSLMKKCEDILIIIAAIVNISTQYYFR